MAYFFLDFDAGFLNSLYSISPDVNAKNADAAVIKPEINPPENHANRQTDKIKTIVSPKFFAKTFKIFSKVLIFIPFVWTNILYHKKEDKNTNKKRLKSTAVFYTGDVYMKTFYKITWPPKRAVRGIGPNDERGDT